METTDNLLRTLTSPTKPAEKSYQEIIKLLGDHVSPMPLSIAERFKFHKVHNLLVNYKNMFRNCTACLAQKKPTLSAKSQSTPILIKARPIPFAMRPKVEQELEKLERDGIMSKIECKD